MDSSNKHMICEEELLPLVYERLEAGFKVRYLSFRGVSMLPMLRQGKDSVELAPLPEKLKKYIGSKSEVGQICRYTGGKTGNW